MPAPKVHFNSNRTGPALYDPSGSYALETPFRGGREAVGRLLEIDAGHEGVKKLLVSLADE